MPEVAGNSLSDNVEAKQTKSTGYQLLWHRYNQELITDSLLLLGTTGKPTFGSTFYPLKVYSASIAFD